MLLRFRTSRRRKLLAQPLAPGVAQALKANVGFLARLSPSEREHVMALGRIFASEKTFEAAGALNGTAPIDLDEAKRLIIGVQAAWMLAGLGLDPLRDAIFPNVSTIILYPGAYWNSQPQVGPGGVVTEGRLNLGEAHHGPGFAHNGPVLLSWPDVLSGAQASAHVLQPQPLPDGGMGGQGGEGGEGGGSMVIDARELRARGHNVVLHELAHKIDMLDGVVDGTPPLPPGAQACAKGSRWRDVMTSSFNQLRAEASRGRPTILDTYGAQNPAEFFAVCVELFFMQPVVMRWRHPELFEVLACVFKQQRTSAS